MGCVLHCAPPDPNPNAMPTRGIDHLGLAVLDLDPTTRFFVDHLGWKESGRDPAYPRTAVSDGHLRLTLWQVDHGLPVESFDRRKNVGLHHIALAVESEAELHALHERLAAVEEVRIEFPPEPVGGGPRRHMMCLEPGGIRVEFIWSGEDRAR